MNEGLVRVGSRLIEIGRLRSAVSLAGGLAVGAGIAIGVASSVPTGSLSAIANLPARVDATGRFASGRVTEVNGAEVKLALPRAPSAAPTTTSSPTTADSSAVADPPPVRTRVVRLQPGTRLPAQPPRPGDSILAIGRPEPDGSMTASAVTLRRPGQLQRR